MKDPRYFKVNYNYKKLVHFFNEITTNYLDKVQPLIYDTDKNTTYLVTLSPTKNINVSELKKIRPLFLKLLSKNGLKYFLGTEIGKNGLFHYHIDIITPKSFRLKSIIEKYFANNMIRKHYPNIKYHIQKINHPAKGGYDYPIKHFNKLRCKALDTSDLENEAFFKYMRRFSKYQKNASIYNLFDTNIFNIVSYKEAQTLRYKMSQLKLNTTISLIDKTKSLEEVFNGLNWRSAKPKS